MDETHRRPFACTIQGCDMTFTNEDHLNWHQKKHDMILNLGLANKNSDTADQTPTPTRFIRNCEEVGLFQDLQNVNPFDETFKQAIETTNNGGSLQVLNTNTDDTLHTPHILPHQVTENNNVVNTEKSPDDLIYALPSDRTKNKLKEAIMNKETKKKLNVMVASVEKINKRLAGNIENNNIKEVLHKKTKKRKDDQEKTREMNRAAQGRCRRKKQEQQKQMEEDYNFIKFENHRLNLENENYRHKFDSLKKLIETHRPSGSPLLNEIDKILSAPLLDLSSCRANRVKPDKVVPVMRNLEPNEQPMLIQVVGNISKFAVSVLPK